MLCRNTKIRKCFEMIPVVSPAQAAQLDKYMIEKKRIAGLLLMEQAADEVARAAIGLNPSGPILVVCGKGNNGGDGLAAARILKTRGYTVKVGVTSPDYRGDAAVNFEFFAWENSYTVLDSQNIDDFFNCNADVIIDAVFGTGLSREPEGLYADIIDHINAHRAKVVSVDIPSGVFGSTGFCNSAVYADITVTFQYPKVGHFIFPGFEHTGKLIVKKIGIDDGSMEFKTYHVDELSLPKRARNTNKGNYGKLTIVAGSKNYSGAAALCSRAALRAGAGLVTCACDAVTAQALKASLPEAMTIACGEDFIQDVRALEDLISDHPFALGPGIATSQPTANVVRTLIKLKNPKVVDADALNILSSSLDMLEGSNCIITPHPKEFSRLTGLSVPQILSDPLHHAKEFARKMGIVVLLKGSSSVITDGNISYIVTAGAPSMAKGGSGDVLTGVAGGLLAQKYSLIDAAYTAAYLCGKAGEAANKKWGDFAPLASDTINCLHITE